MLLRDPSSPFKKKVVKPKKGKGSYARQRAGNRKKIKVEE